MASTSTSAPPTTAKTTTEPPAPGEELTSRTAGTSSELEADGDTDDGFTSAVNALTMFTGTTPSWICQN